MSSLCQTFAVQSNTEKLQPLRGIRKGEMYTPIPETALSGSHVSLRCLHTAHYFNCNQYFYLSLLFLATIILQTFRFRQANEVGMATLTLLDDQGGRESFVRRPARTNRTQCLTLIDKITHASHFLLGALANVKPESVLHRLATGSHAIKDCSLSNVTSTLFGWLKQKKLHISA